MSPTSTAARSRDLVPEDLQRNGRARDVLYRAAAAVGRAKVIDASALDLTSDDQPANILLRAATNPATLATPSWAGAL